ncbi:MAG: cytochrome c553 [Lentimonas sp.]|jgi:cytochrome c553
MRAVLVFLLLSLSTNAQADFDAASYPPYERCALCHGLFGQSHLDKFPHLAGQKPAYIQAQLDAFLTGARTNDGGQMSAIVTELKAEEFAVVVAWFAEQDPPEPSAQPATSMGKELTEALGCLDCHSGDAAVPVPHLTAQHAGYLAKQMRDFRDGGRTHSEAALVHQNLLADREAGIEDIAAYLSSLQRTP